MEAPIEIVHVITENQLIDSESYQRTLGTTYLSRLQPGFYIVQWSSTDAMSRYDGSTDFIGPFTSRRSAELACDPGHTVAGGSTIGIIA